MGIREKQAYAHRKRDDFTTCSDCKKPAGEVDLYLTPEAFIWQFAHCAECYFDRYGEYPKGYIEPINYDLYDMDA